MSVESLKLPLADPFLAGQYIDILIEEGRRRSFSIASAPESEFFADSFSFPLTVLIPRVSVHE